jgi:hypothetical protein
MPDFAVTTAFRATDRITPAFDRMGNAANRFGRRGSAAMRMVGNAARTMIPFFGVAMFARTGARAIELASDLTEVQNVVNVTFRESSAEIDRWASTALEAYGLSELQAKQFTGQLGAMMRSSGIASDQLVEMSTNLTGLAGDFASFYNLPTEEAFQAIQSGLAGQVQPLRRMGINMSIANLEAFALTQGIRKQWRAMTQAEQVQLRYNYLLSVSRDAQGDFNRTLATSFANQKRVLSVKFDQFLAKIAEKILPKLIDLFKNLNRALDKVDTDTIARGLEIIVDLLPYLIGGFLAYKAALIAAAAWQTAIVAAGWVQYLASMLPVMRASIAAQGLYNFLLKGTAIGQAILAIKTGILTAAQWLLNTAFWAFPVFWIIAAIIAVIAIVVLMVKHWDVVVDEFKRMWENFKAGLEIVVNLFLRAKDFMIAGLQALKRSILNALMRPVNMVINGILQLLRLAARIPGIGDRFARAAAQVQEFQRRANEFAGTENPIAPNQATEGTRGVNLRGEININNAPQGTTASTRTTGANQIQMNVTGQN